MATLYSYKRILEKLRYVTINLIELIQNKKRQGNINQSFCDLTRIDQYLILTTNNYDHIRN